MQPEIVAAALPVIETLEALGVRYYVGGSLASSVHGIPRTTLDVDVVAELRPEHVGSFAQRLGEAYYLSQEAIRLAVRERRAFNVIHLATVFKLDVFVSSRDAFQESAMGRAARRSIGGEGGAEAFFASPEDVALHKLHWYRLGDEVSERQWSDVLGVLKAQGDMLDLAYIRSWAEHLRVADLLDRALAEGTTREQ